MKKDNEKMMKCCTTCGEEKLSSREFFSPFSRNGKEYLTNECKSCRSARRRKNTKKVLFTDGIVKDCGKCGQRFPVDHFVKKGLNTSGVMVYGSMCRVCRKKYQSIYYSREENTQKIKTRTKKNRHKYEKEGRRKRKLVSLVAQELKDFRSHNDSNVKLPDDLINKFVDLKIDAISSTHLKKYGLSRQQYADILIAQNGLCAICGVEEATAIDHDHKCCPSGGSCGECVRGVLCRSCNLGLGAAKDDSRILDRAVKLLNGLL